MMVSGVFKGIWRKTRSIRECIRRKLSNIGPLGILWSYKKTIANGKKVYVRLMKRYGANTRIYIEHYPGTGDVYITCDINIARTWIVFDINSRVGTISFHQTNVDFFPICYCLFV